MDNNKTEVKQTMRERLAANQEAVLQADKAKAEASAELSLFFSTDQGKKIWKILTGLSNPLSGDVAVGPTGADVNLTFFHLGRASVSREILALVDKTVAGDMLKAVVA